jgi:hypothetical protein
MNPGWRAALILTIVGCSSSAAQVITATALEVHP